MIKSLQGFVEKGLEKMTIQEVSTSVEIENPPLITGEDLLEMGDIGPYELVEGRIIKMCPTKAPHGTVEMRLARYLGNFIEEHNLGVLMGGEIGLYTRRDPDTIRAADLLFISHKQLAKATPGGFLDVAPQLIVEILSPSDRWVDVRKKLREYFEIGVTVVLIVEPEEQVISLYRSPTDVEEFSQEDTLKIADIRPGFELPLSSLFASH
jgi:Uma2 family endonuclease